jgi:eukaryotic-like serine/threonine-protein kinase
MESTAVVNERYQVDLGRARSSVLTDDFPAEDLLLDRSVMFRALKPHLTDDRAYVERFRRQVQTAANLTHPNIVAVYDWGREREGFDDRDGPTYFVITERPSGRSVASYVEEKGALPVERAVHVMLGVSSAFGYSHRNGALHGGLRPEFVSVSPAGLVKVSDFGLTLSQPPDQLDASSIQWLAPEQVRGETPDERSDVYGLGLLCYFLATGRLAFSGETIEDIRRKQLTGVPAAPRKVNPQIPRGLEVLIGRCLAKNPTDRFANVNDVRAALVRVRESIGGAAEPARPRLTEKQLQARADVADEPTRIDIPPMRPPSGTAGVPTPELSAQLDAEEAAAWSGRPTPTPETNPIARREPATREPATREPAKPDPVPARSKDAFADKSPARPATFGDSTPTPSAKTKPASVSAAAQDDDATKLAAPTQSVAREFRTDTKHKEQRPQPREAQSSEQLRVRSNPSPKLQTINSDGIRLPGSAPQEIDIPDRSPKKWLALAAILTAILIGLLALLATTLKDNSKATVAVPDVISMNVEAAQDALSAMGLGIDVAYNTNTTFERDVVFEQSPRSGEQVRSGARVKVTVSSGDGVLRVPDVVTQSEDVAKSTLKTRGFEVKVESRPDASATPGNVVDQDPKADAEAQAGDTVTIFIAARTGSAKIPDVAGKSTTDASADLSAQGFRSTLRQEASASVAKGTVTRTDPPAGTELDRGEAVTIYVSGGAAVIVPSVFGQTEAAAIETLRQQGFVVDRQTRPVSDTNDVGIVLEQTPKTGAETPFGSKVSLIIGAFDPSIPVPTTLPAADAGQAQLITTTTLPPSTITEATTATVPATAAPTVPVTIPATVPPTPAPTVAPTAPPTPAPTQPVEVPPTQGPIPVATTLPA